MRAFSGARPYERELRKRGVEKRAAQKRKKARESKGLEKIRRKMSSILRGGIQIPPQEEERRRSVEVGDESIHWRLARGAIPEKKGAEKIGADERKKSEKERVGIGKIPPQEVERRRSLEVGDWEQ